MVMVEYVTLPCGHPHLAPRYRGPAFSNTVKCKQCVRAWTLRYLDGHTPTWGELPEKEARRK